MAGLWEIDGLVGVGRGAILEGGPIVCTAGRGLRLAGWLLGMGED